MIKINNKCINSYAKFIYLVYKMKFIINYNNMGCGGSSSVETSQTGPKAENVFIQNKNFLPDDIWQITLTWGKKIKDLDLYLLVAEKAISEGDLPINGARCCWRYPELKFGTPGLEHSKNGVISLNQDYRNGNGKEVITIKNINPLDFNFFAYVLNYSKEDLLANSDAEITLTHNGRPVPKYEPIKAATVFNKINAQTPDYQRLNLFMIVNFPQASKEVLVYGNALTKLV